MKNNFFLALIIVLVILLIIAIAVGATLFINKKNVGERVAFVVSDEINGRDTEIARIDFSNSVTGELKIVKSGESSKRLKIAWEEINKKTSLSYNSETQENGKLVMYSKTTSKNQEDWKWAVFDYFQKNSKFVIDIERF